MIKAALATDTDTQAEQASSNYFINFLETNDLVPLAVVVALILLLILVVAVIYVINQGGQVSLFGIIKIGGKPNNKAAPQDASAQTNKTTSVESKANGVVDTPKLTSVNDVTNHIADSIKNKFEKHEPIEVKNLGLDGELTLKWIQSEIISNPDVSNVDYRCVIINPDSPFILPLIDPDLDLPPVEFIQSASAREMINKFNAYANNDDLKRRNINLQVRTYDYPPSIHGFSINDNELYFGYTTFKDGKLSGGVDAYEYVLSSDKCKLAKHYWNSFNTWFEYLWAQGSGMQREPIKIDDAPIVVGHRGAAGLEPENSLDGVRKAIEIGADMVEIDVRCSKDGVVFVLHDAYLDRTTIMQGRLSDYHSSDLIEKAQFKVDNSACMPTLKELCKELSGSQTRLMIEIKDYDNFEIIVNEAKSLLPMTQIAFACFNHDICNQIKSLVPESEVVAIISGVPEYFEQLLLASRIDSVSLDYNTLDVPMIERLQTAGFRVYVWTVNQPHNMVDVIESRCYGVITNYPDLMMSHVKKS